MKIYDQYLLSSLTAHRSSAVPRCGGPVVLIFSLKLLAARLPASPTPPPDLERGWRIEIGFRQNPAFPPTSKMDHDPTWSCQGGSECKGDAGHEPRPRGDKVPGEEIEAGIRMIDRDQRNGGVGV